MLLSNNVMIYNFFKRESYKSINILSNHHKVNLLKTEKPFIKFYYCIFSYYNFSQFLFWKGLHITFILEE